MYFNASARLVEQLSPLRGVVEACDRGLGHLPAGAVHTLSELAQRLGHDEHQVEIVLDRFAREGIVSKAECKICADCETANPLDAKACTQCGETLADAEREWLYTLIRGADGPMAPAVPAAADAIVDAQGKPRATVGIITALQKEFAATCDVFALQDEWHTAGHGGGLRCKYGSVKGSNGGRQVVVAVLLLTPGNNSAAAMASKLLQHFPDLPHVIMCGIAGGIRADGSPEDDVRLGDVVISDRFGVVQFDFGKDKDGIWEPTILPRPPGAQLLQAANYMGAAELLGKRPWESYLPMAEHYEWSKRPADNAAAKEGHFIDYQLNPQRRTGFSVVLHGTIASSNTLLKHAERRDELRAQHRVRAVEMEGSGVADATWQEGRGYLVVRGIVDFADIVKGDAWHGYAAFAAASVVRALLESMPA